MKQVKLISVNIYASKKNILVKKMDQIVYLQVMLGFLMMIDSFGGRDSIILIVGN